MLSKFRSSANIGPSTNPYMKCICLLQLKDTDFTKTNHPNRYHGILVDLYSRRHPKQTITEDHNHNEIKISQIDAKRKTIDLTESGFFHTGINRRC